MRRQSSHLRSTLPNLRPRINKSTHKPDKNRTNTPKRDRRIKENEPADGDGQFVEGADHGVGGGGGDADAPRAGVADEDGGEPGEDHGGDDGVAGGGGEVLG